MSADAIQKLREVHEAIKRDLRKLAFGEVASADARAEFAKLPQSLSQVKSNRYAPLIGAVTGLAVVGIGYVAAEVHRARSQQRWVDKLQASKQEIAPTR